MFEFFVQFYFQWGVHLRKVDCAFTKAASIPARRQSENAGPRLFGFIFRRCPPSRIYFPIFLKLSTKAAKFRGPGRLRGVYFQRTAKGASGKGPRRSTSKSVENMSDIFSTFSPQGKQRQKKVSNIFSALVNNFRGAPVFRHLLGRGV